MYILAILICVSVCLHYNFFFLPQASALVACPGFLSPMEDLISCRTTLAHKLFSSVLLWSATREDHLDTDLGLHSGVWDPSVALSV